MSKREVVIGGVIYVPVTEGNVDAPTLFDALFATWWGRAPKDDAERNKYRSELRVMVHDGGDEDGGEPIDDFIATVLKTMRKAVEA